MHGDSYFMLFNEVADFSELPPKMAGPVEGTNGV
jgi:hypothetical protein